MKKLFVLLLCFLALFAVISCKQDVKEERENGGTLTVRPVAVTDSEDPEVAPAINWGTQPDKFQFILDQAIYSGDTIEFLAKVSPAVTQITVRDGVNLSNNYLKWGVFSVSELKVDDEGWLIIELDEDEVASTCENMAITLTTPQNDDVFISIKNLKINGVLVDFSTWEESTAAQPFLDVPSKVESVITK